MLLHKKVLYDTLLYLAFINGNQQLKLSKNVLINLKPFSTILIKTSYITLKFT